MALRQPLLHDLAVTLAAPTVCLAGYDGQIRDTGTQGVLCGDVRVLGRAVVTVGGAEPEPVSHGVDGAAAEHVVGLLRDHGDPGADPTVWLRRDRAVRPDGVTETFTLVNRSERDVVTDLVMHVATDLAPVETIKAGQASVAVAPEVTPTTLRWSASGLDVVLTAPGATVTADTLTWPVRVLPRSTVTHSFTLAARDEQAVVAAAPLRLARPDVHADDPRLARLLHRALDDLDALLVTESGHPDDPFAAAGAPWFLTLFGRDSLWTATLLLPVDVRLAGGTLRTLARVQGTRHDPYTGEEPGKIPHERRRAPTNHDSDHGTMNLPALYYGTVDATALWICLLRDAWRHGLPAAEVRALLPHLHAALGWIRDHSDRDGDGFVEYFDESGRGLANQGWKDSGDAVRFASGAIAEGPVALAEVQGYVHEALLAGAELLAAFDAGDPAPWRAAAHDLAALFRDRFWVSDADGAFPALALDGNKKPVDALTSNIGHLLGTGLLTDEESSEIGARLLAPDMANGYGLRTMSARTGGYSPLSYHCGSVWPHDTAIVARGLARSGQADRAAALGVALLAAADGFDQRLPELFAGFGADEVGAPVPYPASCRPQAWAAAASVGLLHALLGLVVDVPAGVVTLAPPASAPLGALRVRGLAVAGGHLDVDVDATGGVTYLAAPGGMRVELTGPITTRSTGAAAPDPPR